MASGVSPGRPALAADRGSSSDSSDRSHAANRGACGDPARAVALGAVAVPSGAACAVVVTGLAAVVTGLAAVKIRAAACLQLNPTGQLH